MLRGKDVSRSENFSDAAFGFALALLVVSLEAPEYYADLQRILIGFPAFADESANTDPLHGSPLYGTAQTIL